MRQKEYLNNIVYRAHKEAAKASARFPQPNYVLLKVAEEAGEVVRAGVHYTENRMPWSELEDEAIQLIAMVFLLLIEGDEVIGLKPPDMAFTDPV